MENNSVDIWEKLEDTIPHIKWLVTKSVQYLATCDMEGYNELFAIDQIRTLYLQVHRSGSNMPLLRQLVSDLHKVLDLRESLMKELNVKIRLEKCCSWEDTLQKMQDFLGPRSFGDIYLQEELYQIERLIDNSLCYIDVERESDTRTVSRSPLFVKLPQFAYYAPIVNRDIMAVSENEVRVLQYLTSFAHGDTQRRFPLIFGQIPFCEAINGNLNLLILEHVPSPTLGNLIDTERYEMIKPTMMSVIDALLYLNQYGVSSHSDLHVGNVMMGDFAVLIDFEYATLYGDNDNHFKSSVYGRKPAHTLIGDLFILCYSVISRYIDTGSGLVHGLGLTAPSLLGIVPSGPLDEVPAPILWTAKMARIVLKHLNNPDIAFYLDTEDNRTATMSLILHTVLVKSNFSPSLEETEKRLLMIKQSGSLLPDKVSL